MLEEVVQSTGREEMAGNHGASGVQGRRRLQIGSRALGGAHSEHEVHVCDAGGAVEAQRLIERPRVLPRVKRRAYGMVRGAEYRKAGSGERSRCMQRAGEGSTADWEQGTGRSARRTSGTCS